MQSFFAYELFFLPTSSDNGLTKLLSYLGNAFRTMTIVWRSRPRVLWVQLAPVFLLYVAHALRLARPSLRLVADCHNSMFSARWLRFPLAVRLLNRCDVVLVHNEVVREAARRAGVEEDKLQLLETRPAQLDCNDIDTTAVRQRYPSPWVLAPASYSRDEPIAALISAARIAPDITFVVTGDPARARGLHDLSDVPANFCMTGFLDASEYDQHVCAAALLVGLTIQDDIQLSVANEAAGAGKPMVISDTPLLRKLFDSGAVYVESTSSSAIAAGVRRALETREALVSGVLALRERRIGRWLSQAQEVMARLG